MSPIDLHPYYQTLTPINTNWIEKNRPLSRTPMKFNFRQMAPPKAKL